MSITPADIFLNDLAPISGYGTDTHTDPTLYIEVCSGPDLLKEGQDPGVEPETVLAEASAVVEVATSSFRGGTRSLVVSFTVWLAKTSSGPVAMAALRNVHIVDELYSFKYCLLRRHDTEGPGLYYFEELAHDLIDGVNELNSSAYYEGDPSSGVVVPTFVGLTPETGRWEGSRPTALLADSGIAISGSALMDPSTYAAFADRVLTVLLARLMSTD
jgi:hypothetical protein